MYYVSQQNIKNTIPHKSMTSVIISILTMSPQQRRLEDHEYVFRYFYDNKYLCEIQRAKSLNAKQQCIANLEIDMKKPDPSQKSMIIIDRIIVEIDEDNKQKYYVMINQDKKNNILSADQKYLRKNIEILKTYMIAKDMKYSQLLHLAFYMEQINFKYKQEVYKQGSQSNYLYLVKKGQFHYSKNVVNQSQNYHKFTKKDRPKRYDIKLNNPNRLKNSISIQMKVGVIQGGSGQSFGQQEIVAQRKRQYTVKCMSTQNQVIMIPAERYKKIIKDSFTKMEWLKKQNQKKIKFKDEIFNKIKSIKNNYKKYAELISKSQYNKTQELRPNKIEHHNSEHISGQQYSSPINNKNNFSKNRSQSMVSDEKQPKYTTQSLQKSRITQQNDQKEKSNLIRISQHSEQQQEDGTFMITRAQYKKKKKQKQNLNLHSAIITSNTSNHSLLPTIASQKYKISSTHETLDSNVGKNWSASRPILQLRGLRKKFSGMIDSNSLIRQKQQIFNYKNRVSGQSRNDIFPIDKVEKKQTFRQNILSLTKQESRQMRSAVHSKSFMQRLLVQALRKAGYNSQKNTEGYVHQHQNSIVDIKNNLRIPKAKVKLQKLEETSLLQKNAFDQCYFKKLN